MGFFIRPGLTRRSISLLYDVALPNVSVYRTRPFLEYTAEAAALIREFKLAIV